MKRYIVNNVEGREHSKIYASLGQGVIFDLDQTQHGWEDFSKIKTGDMVYVINHNRNVVLGYEVTQVEKNIVLDDDAHLGHIYRSSNGGTVGAIFGTPNERVDLYYPKFVKQNNIESPKINPESGVMLQGFNCAAF